MNTKFKKSRVVVHPLFVPVVGVMLLQLAINLLYILIPLNNLKTILTEGNLISNLTTAGYLILFVALIGAFFDFMKSRNLLDYGSFCVLAFCAFVREQELFRWAVGRDNAAFNAKFILDPNNAIAFKILVIFSSLLLFWAFVHLARKHAIQIIKGFFRYNTIAWSFATFAVFVLLGQSIDHFGKNLTAELNLFCPPPPILTDCLDKNLNAELDAKLETIEECTELLLPIIAAMIFVQYHWIVKRFKTEVPHR
ncbi:MAG: hypothetical protein LBJ00_12395 [Planctomycetaceae bacterium]|jgi:hypothetical protein|nr:hypothetical protein [Planctomycetaceae bacterium]